MDALESDFQDVVNRHAPKIFAVGVQMCRRREDAEDLLQETMLQAYRKWQQFEGRSQVSTWLYRIAARLCMRKQRRKSGEPAHFDPLEKLVQGRQGRTVVDVLESDAKSPLESLMSEEIRQRVEAGLADLPAKYRLPCLLKDLAGLTSPQIAEILDLNEATVKTRVHRGRLALREYLEKILPKREIGESEGHSVQICLDLLEAKQRALDREAEFPWTDEALCARCRSVFLTLDLTQQALASLQSCSLSAEEIRDLMSQIKRRSRRDE